MSCSKCEWLPLNIVEAMLSGTMVVTGRNKGCRKLIYNVKIGFMIDRDNYWIMVERVLKLFKDNTMLE